MLENPNDWYFECGKYAKQNKYTMEYGALFLIDDNAPDTVKNVYRKYINLCLKPFKSLGLCKFENNRLVGFFETDNPTEQEQIDIIKELIRKGYLDNNSIINI